MGKGRLEAFSDGVLAIIITIMVLELKVPHGDELSSLKPMLPIFLSYVLSFINIAIYWNNHHHMMHAVSKVTGTVLWTNVHLLFWLSLFPFCTAWMGENKFSLWPVVAYGFVATMAGIAYYMLAHCLADVHGKDSTIAKALGRDIKGKLSVVIYIAGIAFAFIHPWIGFGLYVLVAAVWFVPDRRIEDNLD
ncbi:MAG TPA: TMEM175 family protein [Ferruginibacter sp.]|nr:TMEM175 family protein [Ferruginibacter sp.]